MVVLLNIRADFPHFTLKTVEHSRYLPAFYTSRGGNTSEIASRPSEVSLRFFAVRACAFSVNPTDRSSRQTHRPVKRNGKRFPVNGCQRCRCHAMIVSSRDGTSGTGGIGTDLSDMDNLLGGKQQTLHALHPTG